MLLHFLWIFWSSIRFDVFVLGFFVNCHIRWLGVVLWGIFAWIFLHFKWVLPCWSTFEHITVSDATIRVFHRFIDFFSVFRGRFEKARRSLRHDVRFWFYNLCFLLLIINVRTYCLTALSVVIAVGHTWVHIFLFFLRNCTFWFNLKDLFLVIAIFHSTSVFDTFCRLWLGNWGRNLWTGIINIARTGELTRFRIGSQILVSLSRSHWTIGHTTFTGCWCAFPRKLICHLRAN